MRKVVSLVILMAAMLLAACAGTTILVHKPNTPTHRPNAPASVTRASIQLLPNVAAPPSTASSFTPPRGMPECVPPGTRKCPITDISLHLRGRHPVATKPPPRIRKLSGAPTVGQVLNSSQGTWTNSPTSFSYQWFDCNSGGSSCSAVAPGTGGTTSTYLVQSSDVGFTLEVVVTASNGSGSATSTSAHTLAVVASTGTTMGTTTIGSTTTTGSDADTKRVNSYVSPATGTLTGLQLYLTPGAGTGSQTVEGIVYSDSTGPNALLATSTPITFSSSNTAGWYSLPLASGLSVTSGTTYWIGFITGGPNSVAGFSWTALTGARDYNANVYTSGPSNPFGTVTTDNEQMSEYAQITPGTSPNTGLPIISGTLVQGDVLTATNGLWNNSPASFTYQWKRCSGSCTNISGATSSTYTLVSGDVGDTIEVAVTENVGPNTATSSQTTTVTTSLPGPPPGVTCDKVASPSGSDSNAGTLASPYLTVQHLSDSLTASQTGCVRAGNYNVGGGSISFSTANVTITGYPGDATPVLHGFPWMRANGVTLSYVKVDLDDASDPWSALCNGNSALGGGAVVTFDLLIDASNVTISHDNIYVDPSIATIHRGLGIGNGFSNAASGVVISDNRIHDVGFCPVEEHGVYLDNTTSDQVTGNWIYNIPGGTGVQLWDHAHSDTVSGNVMDQTSSCTNIGSNTTDSTNNTITHNICVNMGGVHDAGYAFCNNGNGPGGIPSSCTGPEPGVLTYDSWGGSASGNVVSNNDVFCATGFTAHCTTADGSSGVTVSGTITSDPQFADPNYATSHDYTLKSTSPAIGYGTSTATQMGLG